MAESEAKSRIGEKAEPDSEEHGPITKDTPIGEAAMSSPEAPMIMMSYGLHCLGCGMTAYETIEQGCAGHGMPDEIIDRLVDELNEAADEAAADEANQ